MGYIFVKEDMELPSLIMLRGGIATKTTKSTKGYSVGRVTVPAPESVDAVIDPPAFHYASDGIFDRCQEIQNPESAFGGKHETH